MPRPKAIYTRHAELTILVTPDEREEIKAAAAANLIPVSSYLRAMALLAIRGNTKMTPNREQERAREGVRLPTE
jgi:hypothetical protein